MRFNGYDTVKGFCCVRTWHKPLIIQRFTEFEKLTIKHQSLLDSHASDIETRKRNLTHFIVDMPAVLLLPRVVRWWTTCTCKRA
jgi:hypothetical protein